MPRIPHLSFALLSFSLLAAACSGDVPTIQPLPDQGPSSLSEALGIDSPTLVGITVSPSSGRRFVLDQNEGIFEIYDDGSGSRVRSLAELPSPDLTPRSAFTDFVALTDTQFAITARGDGYLLDLEAETLTQYFCYEPGWEEPQLEQLTDSVAFDPELGVLFAQPQTFNLDQPEVAVASSIGLYTLDGGQPFGWFEMPSIEMRAGGATVLGDGSLLLGEGAQLFRFDRETGLVEELATLNGVSHIDGLAFDAASGRVLALDSGVDRLVEFEVQPSDS